MGQLFDAIQERTSVRAFKPDPVKAEDVEKIVNAAIWAPNGMNAQNWHFTVVTDRALLDEMDAATKEGMIASGNPMLAERAQDPKFNAFFHAPMTIIISHANSRFSAFDCGAAAQNICLAAKDLGYDTCIMAMVEPMFAVKPELKEKLQIPADFSFLCSIPVGIKDEEADEGRVRGRREDVISYL